MGKSAAGDIVRGYGKMLIKAATTTLQNASDDVQSSSRDVVARWHNKSDFGDETLITKARIEVTIKPKGSRKVVQIFGYVDQGTKGPYLIPKFPRPNTMLRFQTGYNAFTQPTARYNVGSGRSFGSWVSKKQVTHPGIKPRKFMETFGRELVPALYVRLQNEIDRQLA